MPPKAAQDPLQDADLDVKDNEELGKVATVKITSEQLFLCLTAACKVMGLQPPEDFSRRDSHLVGKRVLVPPNTYWFSKADNQGMYLIPGGWYFVYGTCRHAGEGYQLMAVAQKRGSDIIEIGPSEGTITSAHLQSKVLFEALLERLSNSTTSAQSSRLGSFDTNRSSPLQRLRSGTWGIVFEYLVPANTQGVFTFRFDAGLLAAASSCKALERVVMAHPMWITRVLALPAQHIGSVLAYPSLTCLGVTKYICMNAANLPDVIRNDPDFRNILRPETRHKIAKREAMAYSQPALELPAKVRVLQVISAFLLGEPSYRGDTSKDPVTAELIALLQTIAKDDPIFVLKMANYVRHTLGFRTTTNFLLATAVKIEECRPFVRTALPKCTNLPTDLLELWDFWRKLSGRIQLPSCLKAGFADKFTEFSEYQLAKYLNAKVPKPQQVTIKPAKKKGKMDEKDEATIAKEKLEADLKKKDPLLRPLTLKSLVRTIHAGKNQSKAVCGVLRKQYPHDEEDFKYMHLDDNGKEEFDPSRCGEKFRIPIPKTWETELSEKGNTPAVWEELVKSKNLPFMAMIKNLRNVIMAGVNDECHNAIIGRLKNAHQVANSKQQPIKFLSAFEAIDFDEATLARLVEEAKNEADYVEEEKAYGTGKEAKKVVRKRLVCRNPPNKKLLDRYRDALETAVSLAATNNIPPLELPGGGKAIVLVDVSGSMESPLTTGPRKLHESALTPHRRANGKPIVEGQDMDLEDYFQQSGQRSSKKISVSMTWIGQDLDLSCNVMDKNGQTVVNVSYQQLGSQAIWHSGDITSAPNGAEEIVTVDLDGLPENAFMMTFTVNSYSGQKFDDIAEAAISVRDDGLEGNSVEGTAEICCFRLTGNSKAVIACSLIKKETGWAFRCLNTVQSQGATVQSLLTKIKQEYDALMADMATNGKRLVDAAMLLALCLRMRMGDDKCEVVLYSSEGKDGGPGYLPLRTLGPKVLGNVRRCHAAAKQLGRGSKIPIGYLQELAASGTKIEHLLLLTDGLVSPAKSPGGELSRWLRSYRASLASGQRLKYCCVDVLGLGKPCLGDGSATDDTLISGYSDAVLRYITQEPGAQLAEVEAISLPPPKEQTKKEEASDSASFSPPSRT